MSFEYYLFRLYWISILFRSLNGKSKNRTATSGLTTRARTSSRRPTPLLRWQPWPWFSTCSVRSWEWSGSTHSRICSTCWCSQPSFSWLPGVTSSTRATCLMSARRSIRWPLRCGRPDFSRRSVVLLKKEPSLRPDRPFKDWIQPPRHQAAICIRNTIKSVQVLTKNS